MTGSLHRSGIMTGKKSVPCPAQRYPGLSLKMREEVYDRLPTAAVHQEEVPPAQVHRGAAAAVELRGDLNIATRKNRMVLSLSVRVLLV